MIARQEDARREKSFDEIKATLLEDLKYEWESVSHPHFLGTLALLLMLFYLVNP